MPAVSVAQRRAAALALRVKRGTLSPKKVSKRVREMAKSMTVKELKAFAGTKESKLPKKKG